MIVHLGVILIAVALVASNAYTKSAELTVRPGEAVEWEGHTFELVDVRGGAVGPHRRGARQCAARRQRRVRAGGHDLPQAGHRRSARRACAPASPATCTSPSRQPAAAPGATEVHLEVFLKPLIIWLWIGGPMMAAGTVLAAFPGGRRRADRSRVVPPVPTTPSPSRRSSLAEQLRRRGGAAGGAHARIAPFIAGGVAIVLVALFVVLPTAETTHRVGGSPLIGKSSPALDGRARRRDPVRPVARKGELGRAQLLHTDCVPCMPGAPRAGRVRRAASALGTTAPSLHGRARQRSRAGATSSSPTAAATGRSCTTTECSRSAVRRRSVPETWIIDPDGFVRARIISEVTADGLGSMISRCARVADELASTPG